MPSQILNTVASLGRKAGQAVKRIGSAISSTISSKPAAAAQSSPRKARMALSGDAAKRTRQIVNYEKAKGVHKQLGKVAAPKTANPANTASQVAGRRAINRGMANLANPRTSKAVVKVAKTNKPLNLAKVAATPVPAPKPAAKPAASPAKPISTVQKIRQQGPAGYKLANQQKSPAAAARLAAHKAGVPVRMHAVQQKLGSGPNPANTPAAVSKRRSANVRAGIGQSVPKSSLKAARKLVGRKSAVGQSVAAHRAAGLSPDLGKKAVRHALGTAGMLRTTARKGRIVHTMQLPRKR